MRPTPAAQPEPVARSEVGYISGVTAYSAPHAPRLKNDSAMPVAMTAGSAAAVPKKTADDRRAREEDRERQPAPPHLDEPGGDGVAGQLRERDDQREAEGAHEVVPLRTRIDGIQMNAP